MKKLLVVTTLLACLTCSEKTEGNPLQGTKWYFRLDGPTYWQFQSNFIDSYFQDVDQGRSCFDHDTIDYFVHGNNLELMGGIYAFTFLISQDTLTLTDIDGGGNLLLISSPLESSDLTICPDTTTATETFVFHAIR